MFRGKSLTRDLIFLFTLLFLIKFYEDYCTIPMKNRTPQKHARYVASRIVNNTLWYVSFGTKQLQKKIAPTHVPLEEGSNASLLLAQLSTAHEYLKQDLDSSETNYNNLMAELTATASYIDHIHSHYGPQEGVERTAHKESEYIRKMLKAAQRTAQVLTDIVNELCAFEQQCPQFNSVKDALDYNENLIKTFSLRD